MLRVGFFGQSGPYAPVALSHLLRASQEDFEVALVVQGLSRRGGRQTQRLCKNRGARPGEPPAGRILSDAASWAGIPVLQTSDVNEQRAVDIVASFELDLIVCVGFNCLFKAPLLGAVARGGLNAHPSRLPFFRGPSPLFWMLKEGLREGAVTLHGMDLREDHGPIYAQESYAFPPLAQGEELFSLAGELAGRMLLPALAQAARGKLEGKPQEHAQATRAPRPRPEDARVGLTEWDCEPLIHFASGAAYARAPWLRLGHETIFTRRGIWAKPGERLPGQYVLRGSTLIVQCRDGTACVEVQV